MFKQIIALASISALAVTAAIAAPKIISDEEATYYVNEAYVGQLICLNDDRRIVDVYADDWKECLDLTEMPDAMHAVLDPDVTKNTVLVGFDCGHVGITRVSNRDFAYRDLNSCEAIEIHQMPQD